MSNNPKPINLESIDFSTTPYPHFEAKHVLSAGLDKTLFEWFEKTDAWSFVRTEFYEQYEFSLLEVNPPSHLYSLVSNDTIIQIASVFHNTFHTAELELVGVTAHKLIHEQRIGIHNDFIDGEETHRLVIHVHPNWTPDNGGYYMMFHSSNPEDLSKIVEPISNSATAFEISERSHHAVSAIYDHERYSLIYTFKEI